MPTPWSPATTCAGATAPTGPSFTAAPTTAATRAISCSPRPASSLRRLRFPLGDMDKTVTREHARRFGLSVASKPDSQDICFVPDGQYASVLEKLRPGVGEPGDIVDLDGTVLARHDGIIHYTVGQRRGLGIGGGTPLYVIRLEPETRRVVVGPKEALLRNRLEVRDVNWLGAGDDPPVDGLKVAVKLRSAQPLIGATVYGRDGGRAEVVLDDHQAGIAAGQACVFYDGDRMLGGGWIVRDTTS